MPLFMVKKKSLNGLSTNRKNIEVRKGKGKKK